MNVATSSPRKRPSKWMRSRIRPGCFWGDRVRQTIASQVESIRHWEIRNVSYLDCPAVNATWFVDPPYQNAGKHYRFGSKTIDYGILGQWCQARAGQVIVCENDGATWLPFEKVADVKTARKGRKSAEAVYLHPSTQGIKERT